MSSTKVSIQCPGCNSIHKAPATMIGRKVKCQTCNEVFVAERFGAPAASILEREASDKRFVPVVIVSQPKPPPAEIVPAAPAPAAPSAPAAPAPPAPAPVPPKYADMESIASLIRVLGMAILGAGIFSCLIFPFGIVPFLALGGIVFGIGQMIQSSRLKLISDWHTQQAMLQLASRNGNFTPHTPTPAATPVRLQPRKASSSNANALIFGFLMLAILGGGTWIVWYSDHQRAATLEASKQKWASSDVSQPVFSSPPAPTPIWTSPPPPNPNPAPTPKPVEAERPWYAGGTLHKATVAQWSRAERRDRLATAADFVCDFKIARGIQPQDFDMDNLKIEAAALIVCIDTATEGISQIQQHPVSEYAFQCLRLMKK